METKYNIGDDLYIKVKVKSINITESGNTRYTVELPSMYFMNGIGEIWEDQLYNNVEVMVNND